MFDIFTYEFARNALIVGCLIGLMLPLVGVIVIQRRMTFIADSFGHINMSGVAFSIFLIAFFPIFANFSFFIILLWTVFSAILIEYLRDKYQNYKELSIIVVYSIAVSLTMLFLSLSTGYNASLFNLLFGNINGISNHEVITIFISEIIFFLIVFLTYKKILLLSLDEDYIKVYNINPKKYKYLSMILIAISISISIKTIGVLLVSSLMIIPLLSASIISKNLKTTAIYSVIFTEISIIVGIFISFYFGLPTSAIIVLFSIIIYLLLTIKVKYLRR